MIEEVVSCIVPSYNCSEAASSADHVNPSVPVPLLYQNITSVRPSANPYGNSNIINIRMRQQSQSVTKKISFRTKYCGGGGATSCSSAATALYINHRHKYQISGTRVAELTRKFNNLILYEYRRSPKLRKFNYVNVNNRRHWFLARRMLNSSAEHASVTSDDNVVRDRINLFEQTNTTTKSSSDGLQTAADKVDDRLEVISMPAVLPTPRCDSMYENQLRTVLPPPPPHTLHNNDVELTQDLRPNTSFLWSKKDAANLVSKQPTSQSNYEPIDSNVTVHMVGTATNHYEEMDNIYETCSINYSLSNYYESIADAATFNYDEIASKKEDDTYESVYGGDCNRQSVLSSVQQNNSIYEPFMTSVLSEDDIEERVEKAKMEAQEEDDDDQWTDVSDDDTRRCRLLERPKKTLRTRKAVLPNSIAYREPAKVPLERQPSSNSEHLYESLSSNSSTANHPAHAGTTEITTLDGDYDSFDSDDDALHDSGVDFNVVNKESGSSSNSTVPRQVCYDVPTNCRMVKDQQETYMLTRLAARAGKHMSKLRRNWSVKKSHLSKSLGRMAKLRANLSTAATDVVSRRDNVHSSSNTKDKATTEMNLAKRPTLTVDDIHVLRPIPTSTPPSSLSYSPSTSECYENVYQVDGHLAPCKSFLNRFRRSVSISPDVASEAGSSASQTTYEIKRELSRSTFYLNSDELCVDDSPDKCHITYNSLTYGGENHLPKKTDLSHSEPSISWYKEAGLFGSRNAIHTNRSNTCWYAEVGLYEQDMAKGDGTLQTRSIVGTHQSTPTSSAENSGSRYHSQLYALRQPRQSTCSSTASLNSHSDKEKNRKCGTTSSGAGDGGGGSNEPLNLDNEPLYQFYDDAVVNSVVYSGAVSGDSDTYEDPQHKVSSEKDTTANSQQQNKSFNLSTLSASQRPIWTLWCELPEVINSSILDTLTTQQKKVQEAKFEMIRSEASYLNSLNVLCYHFADNIRTSGLLRNPRHIDILFGQLESVRACSQRLLRDFLECWQSNILLHHICSIVERHAKENFKVYVSYCEMHTLFEETLNEAKTASPEFGELLRRLESDEVCQSLTLHSFLMLPMQRITRWPLLIDAVLKRLRPQDDEYERYQCTLAMLNHIVNECNEAAKRREREQELRRVARQLVQFDRHVKPVEIFKEGRWLVRSGPVMHIQPKSDDIRLTFGRKLSKQCLHLFLFNDMLFVARIKSDGTYLVMHYCARNLVEVTGSDAMMRILPFKDAQLRQLLQMTLLENQSEKTVEFLISCGTESDKERWLEALTPPKSDDPDEVLYECWDCPQVTVVHNYAASQPDELTLTRGEVINVLRKMNDGWFHGERLRDGETGWFPSNYTMEIANPHVRSRNLKLRYRLLALSDNYLKHK